MCVCHLNCDIKINENFYSKNHNGAHAYNKNNNNKLQKLLYTFIWFSENKIKRARIKLLFKYLAFANIQIFDIYFFLNAIIFLPIIIMQKLRGEQQKQKTRTRFVVMVIPTYYFLKIHMFNILYYCCICMY